MGLGRVILSQVADSSGGVEVPQSDRRKTRATSRVRQRPLHDQLGTAVRIDRDDGRLFNVPVTLLW